MEYLKYYEINRWSTLTLLQNGRERPDILVRVERDECFGHSVGLEGIQQEETKLQGHGQQRRHQRDDRRQNKR